MESFDHIIVGGGSAGSVLAYRLTEAGRSVCVLEAGPVDTNRYIRVPAGFTKTLFDPAVTFQYLSEPVPALNGRRVPITQGRVIGGSSSVNGMVFNRGQAFDFDRWAQWGNRGWNYREILPYFKRLETRIGTGDDLYRGRSGPLPITSNDWQHPLCDAFVAGAQELGLPWNEDYNGAQQEGVGFYQRAIQNGRRVSAAHAFLHPARERGAEVRTDALVSRVVIENGRAIGVEYLLGDSPQARRVLAREAVIIAAGVTQSPKLLQLSGLGPGDLLAAHGIAVKHELPGVGENLRDHYSPRLVARVKNTDSLNSRARGVRLLAEVTKWLLGKPSILALTPALVHGFGRTDPALPQTDYALVYAPGSHKQGFIGRLDDYDGLTCGAWQMRPESRGYVRISSSDPRELPAVMPNYLAEELDRRTLVPSHWHVPYGPQERPCGRRGPSIADARLARHLRSGRVGDAEPALRKHVCIHAHDRGERCGLGARPHGPATRAARIDRSNSRVRARLMRPPRTRHSLQHRRCSYGDVILDRCYDMR